MLDRIFRVHNSHHYIELKPAERARRISAIVNEEKEARSKFLEKAIQKVLASEADPGGDKDLESLPTISVA